MTVGDPGRFETLRVWTVYVTPRRIPGGYPLDRYVYPESERETVEVTRVHSARVSTVKEMIIST